MEFLAKAHQMFYPFSDKTDVTKKTGQGLTRKRAAGFRSKYSLGAVLGKGTYSVVRKGYNLVTKEPVAVKCIDELALSEKDAKALQREVKILRTLSHRNIISFKDFYYDSKEKMFFIVTEICEGGEMFDAVVAKTSYDEYKVREIMYALTDAVRHLHVRNITHRDLKPENILLKTKHNKGDFAVESLRIADFGFAFQHKDGNKENSLNTVCGSPIYVAPEILIHHSDKNSKGYKAKNVDIWSLGIIMYVLLCGYPPFMASQNKRSGENENERLFEKIKSGKFEFDKRYWKGISNGAKSLIKMMLCVDPKKRPSVHEVLRHHWFDIEKHKEREYSFKESPELNVRRTKRVHARSLASGHRWSNLKSAVHKLRFLSTTSSPSGSTAASSNRTEQ